jgi:hypothetical protein
MKYKLDPEPRKFKRCRVNATKSSKEFSPRPKLLVDLRGCKCEWCENARRQAQQEMALYNLPEYSDEQMQFATLEVDLESYGEYILKHGTTAK